MSLSENSLPLACPTTAERRIASRKRCLCRRAHYSISDLRDSHFHFVDMPLILRTVPVASSAAQNSIPFAPPVSLLSKCSRPHTFMLLVAAWAIVSLFRVSRIPFHSFETTHRPLSTLTTRPRPNISAAVTRKRPVHTRVAAKHFQQPPFSLRRPQVELTRHNDHPHYKARQPPPPLPVPATPASPFPPPLSKILPAPRPANLAPQRDWRRPAILTAHVNFDPDTNIHTLTVFTAGILLTSQKRCFHVVGCQIGNSTYPAQYTHRAKVLCLLPPTARPTIGDPISVLLELDQNLKNALAGPVTTQVFTFDILPGDVYPLPAYVDVHPTIKEKVSPEPRIGPPSNIMVVATNTTWQDYLVDERPSPSTPRHEFCMMTSMKQYPFLLPGWIRYYRRLGVDRFYIYDNNAVSDLSVYNSPFVEVVYWPYARSQTQLFTHFLVASKARCKYAGFFDADEYVLLGDAGPAPLKRYVKYKVSNGFPQVVFPFLVMRNNGYVRIPKGELPELYTKRSLNEFRNRGKVILDVDAGWDIHIVHVAVRRNSAKYFNLTLELSPKSFDYNAMLVHFTTRSWEEHVLKQQVGSASTGTYRMPNEKLSVDDPKDWYMEYEPVAEWNGMRDYFQAVMKGKDDGGSILTWVEGQKVCNQKWYGTQRKTTQFKPAVCKT